MTRPDFDALAPHYRWIEAITFGPLLQWCRTAMLPHLRECKRALVLGDGNGRFLAELLSANATVEVEAVDISPAMVALARQRIGSNPRIGFRVADARLAAFPPNRYDLIVANFFLDCFPNRELESLVPKLASTLQAGGQWVIADFRLPARGWPKLGAHAALAVMYGFFKVVTRLPAGHLVDPEPLLGGCGLSLEQRETGLCGFLSASLWRKPL